MAQCLADSATVAKCSPLATLPKAKNVEQAPEVIVAASVEPVGIKQ